MFEIAELGRKVSKEEFDAIATHLRMELVALQQRLRSSNFPMILVFAGVNGAGKQKTVNLINEWMDPRWIQTRAYGQPSEEERERPDFWRYWRDLPPKGQIGMFLSCWYSQPLLDRVYKKSSVAEYDDQLARIAGFEKTLADDGALILKFWMHLNKDNQHARLKALEKDPNEQWRVTKLDWKHYRLYDNFIAAAERGIMRTDHAHAPWALIEGADARYRYLTVLTRLRDALKSHLDAREALKKSSKAKASAKPAAKARAKSTQLAKKGSVLAALDMKKKLDREAYGEELWKQRARLNTLYRKAKEKGHSLVLVFEGWDAAGKGGAIRRLTSAFDAHDFRVIPFGAPTDEERAQHYLWRFWRHLARAGTVTIYDRSWYGRVLVERVENFAKEEEWKRAYSEINDFEEQLVEHGIIVMKYWLHISKDEQMRRFKQREQIAYKRWKLTDEDWRNRAKWDAYESAVTDMVEHTSTRLAPWTLVEGNDKNYARIKLIKTLCKRLETVLGK